MKNASEEGYVPLSQTREDVNCKLVAETAVGSRAATFACNDITLNNVYTHSVIRGMSTDGLP